MTRSHALILGALLLSRVAIAQEPARDTSATPPAPVTIPRLPVLDDAGHVIPEDLIRETMRPPRHVVMHTLIGAFVGLVMFTTLSSHDADCSIYEPCTAREKFRERWAPLTGISVGVMLGLAWDDGSIDRERAVELLRARLRANPEASPR